MIALMSNFQDLISGWKYTIVITYGITLLRGGE